MTTTLLTPTARPKTTGSKFLAYFLAMAHHIELLDDLHSLTDKPKFQNFESTIDEKQIGNLGKLLLNGWSAEYALRITPVVNDSQYLQSSLHWTFPQAFYSILFTSRAILLAMGQSISEETLVGKEISNLVVRGYYPESIGYYASQLPKARRLPADSPITDFLLGTRYKRLKRLIDYVQSNPKTLLRRSKTGNILLHLSPEEKQKLNGQVGYTTFFHLFSRLRITTENQRDLLDMRTSEVRLFHDTLVTIVSHINAVQEAYIAKGIGQDRFQKIVNGMPSYLKDGFITERFTP